MTCQNYDKPKGPIDENLQGADLTLQMEGIALKVAEMKNANPVVIPGLAFI
ncbi:hypothetical protein [Spirosoma foliorum]|uniref:Uncharacterized protein n=1 Tax=Spirosoma foliorum TaxID=2710596 RepID=A0A7G5GW19_9BACT|nr:hypothetical protein [Spirosoma foliorum]QMW03061.1 hypothetical protein H3H32_35155 [Spirosoma foliorum]